MNFNSPASLSELYVAIIGDMLQFGTSLDLSGVYGDILLTPLDT